MQKIMHFSWLALPLAAALAAPVAAADWKPLPAELWTLRADPAKGYRDAVVLEKRTLFANAQIETIYRVRVFSPAGIAAAAVPAFSPDCHHIEGRTVHPDGRELSFHSARDFQPLAGNGQRLLPPGVDADCIVELRWQESTWKRTNAPLPRRLGAFGEWPVGGPYATLEESLELVDGFRWPTRLLPGGPVQPQVTAAGGWKRISFQRLPAIPSPPPCTPPSAQPRLQVFELPKVLFERLNRGIDAFWEAALIVPIPRLITRDRIAAGSDRTMNTSRVFKDLDPALRDSFSDGVRKGKAFRALAAELLAGLTGGPQERAAELLTRLAGRIGPAPDLPYEPEEREDMEEIDRIRNGPENIEEAVRSRRATPFGMQILFFQLLREAGVQPELALLCRREIRAFDYQLPSIHQFTDRLLGVEEPGRPTLWLDPTRAALRPGSLHPCLQGAEGLRIDTAAWTFQRLRMPEAAQAPAPSPSTPAPAPPASQRPFPGRPL